jgi:hypothetical protein
MIIITTVLRNMFSLPVECIVITLCTLGRHMSFDFFFFINIHKEMKVLTGMLYVSFCNQNYDFKYYIENFSRDPIH